MLSFIKKKCIMDTEIEYSIQSYQCTVVVKINNIRFDFKEKIY